MRKLAAVAALVLILGAVGAAAKEKPQRGKVVADGEGPDFTPPGLIDDIQEDDKVPFEIEEGDRGPIAVDVTDEFGNPVPVTLTWDTAEGDAGNHPSTVTVIDVETGIKIVGVSPGGDGGDTVRLRVTDDDGGSADRTYREGNDAKHEKKLRGPPTFDDLEMERGVKPGDTKLHDWFEDVRAGSADSARKEIAVKMQSEEGDGTVVVVFGRVVNEAGVEATQEVTDR